jgi:hypothetical protein
MKIWKLIKKLKTILFIVAALTLLVVLLSRGQVYAERELSYGATFSKKHAEWLVGERWKDNYTQALDSLGIRKLRIPAYWDEVQKNDGDHYDYADLDWMMDEAERRQAKVVMAVGYRLPRWPECHLPTWAKPLAVEDVQTKTLAYIRKTIERYKDRPGIVAWQVENEPFLRLFGECPEFDPKFLDREIALVKEIDRRPIVVTDSGELSLWVPAAKRADTFGTSMYLNTYSQSLKSYIHYPIGPGFFFFKRNLAGLFAKPANWVVIEMQAEPWGPVSYTEMSEKEKARTMDIKKLRQMLEFGRLAGFREFYLWGVEWWYWEKEVKGNPVYWEEAKNIFK